MPIDVYTLRFYDDDRTISPESFSAKELGELIVSFYNGLKELIDIRYPEVNSDSIHISLIGIENKSESLIWQTSGDTTVASRAIREYGKAIERRTYTDLPTQTYKSVKKIFSITKSKKCNAELVEHGDRLFVVKPDESFIRQEKVLVKSDMLLYGILNKIGGDRNRAWVELFDGSKISFPISDNQLIQLRNRVKEVIAIRGIATWNTLSKQVVYFKINEIIDYDPSRVSEGFENIRHISKGWDTLNTNQSILDFLNGE